MRNLVAIDGRLVADPEIKYTPSGTAVCNTRIACDRDRPDPSGQRATDFFDLVCWGKTAETLVEHQRKGKLIGVTGRIQTRQYETREGQKRTVTEIVADRVYFLERRDGPGQGAGGAGAVGATPGDEDEQEVPF